MSSSVTVVAVESCTADGSEIMLSVERGGLDAHDLIVTPAEASVLRDLLNTYCTTGQSMQHTIRLNVPVAESGTQDAVG